MGALRSILVALALAAGAGAAHAGTFQMLYSFSGGVDGQAPFGKLVTDQAGILYGVTVSGGTAQRGNSFSFNPATGMLTSLYSFSGGADGGNPQSGLTLDASGNLYGVTPHGGLTVSICGSGCGTVFKLHIATGVLTTLYRFTALADGAVPTASPLLLGGALYGSTIEAGPNTECGVYGCGTLFRLELSTNTLKTVHDFDGADGATSEGKLVRASSELLYGSAAEGGPYGSGDDFEIVATGG
jgi:uncharacterized repeat protein (TIGR03803 family)